jgi:EpsI family protein
LDRRPERETLGAVAFVLAMVGVGALGWRLQLAPDLAIDASPLAQLPTRIGSWHSEDVPLPPAVETELGADFNLQRAYTNGIGEVVWLYVGYYGTASGGRARHTPRHCYTGAGWGIESTRVVDVDPGGSVRANEYLIANAGNRRLVHFWYRSVRRTGMLGGLDQNLDRLVGRLFEGRADGALVRVSTPIAGDDTIAARGRLLAFGSQLDPLLASHWPREEAAP